MKNPYLNAFAAGAYIAFIVQVMSTFTDNNNHGPSIFVPMVMLSLFVFSAAVMGFLFVYQPLKLFLDKRQEEALSFFAKTLGTFIIWIAFFFFLLFR